MQVLITLCARGGSKGIPKKNIRLLNGVPLIGYSIHSAEQFKNAINDVVDIALSTDSFEIKEVAKELGLTTEYTRPDFLAGDSAGKVDAIKDVKDYYEKINNKKYDYVLDLDISSPLRTLEDLITAYVLIKGNEQSLNLFSVSKANKNPYFNLVEKGEDGFFHLSKKISNGVLSRQSAPNVYELNASFYFYKKAFFDQGFKTVYSGKAMIYEMDHICFDLDHEIDFSFMEFLLFNNRLGFKI
jgi:CMP-N,N'-diacetyllegionaminic acid synthase